MLQASKRRPEHYYLIPRDQAQEQYRKVLLYEFYCKMICCESIVLLLYIACLLYHSNALPGTPRKLSSQRVPDVLQLDPHYTGLNGDRLSVDVETHHGTHVNPFTLLLNAVDALATIGSQDMNGRSPSYSFQLTKYPNVIIEVKPSPSAADLLNWVASLCIYHGIEDVLRKKLYVEVDIICHWNVDEIVGVSIRDSSSRAASVSASNTTQSNVNVSDTLQSSFFYVSDGMALDYNSAMITLMYSIMYLSRLDKREMVPRTYTDPGPHWDASIVFPGDGPQPPKDPPPFLECGWVIGTLKMAPDYMIQQRKFAELAIKFRANNVDLGHALLQKGKPFQAIS
ncbi:MAG: hypothetical protein Q9182_005292 [Xanthomendoza sp. 2 TL-2023]